jgi:hypothetical protein
MKYLVALLLASIAIPAQAQQVKVSTLPGALPLTGTEKVLVSQGNNCTATGTADCKSVAMTTSQLIPYLTPTFQARDSDLDAIAALATLPFGRSVLTRTDAPAVRTLIGVSATASDTTYAYRANNLGDLTNVAGARTNLGLTAAATTAIGTSGAAIPLLSTANTWALGQTFTTIVGMGGGFSLYPGTDGNITSGAAAFEIGRVGRAVAGAAFIDFHSSASSIISSGGTSGTNGSGTLVINASSLTVTGSLALATPLAAAQGGTGDTGTAWITTFAPVVTSESGTLNAVTSRFRYKTIGKTVFFRLSILITDNGTGAANVTFTLPFTAAGQTTAPADTTYFGGREDGVQGFQLQGKIVAGTSVGKVYKYDNLYPGGTNYNLVISGVYEAL